MKAAWGPRIAVATLTAAICPALPAAALEPYQLVRSLQLVQDRIAGGDHAALPMQQKLLEMVDRQLRTAQAPDFANRRNFLATLLYGMSGGNPVTVDVVLSRLSPEGDDASLAKGVAAYLRGDVKTAMTALEPIEPTALSPEIGAFVALVKGSILTGESPATAIAMFDKARLLGSGTLVEEAALRRTLAVSTDLLDAPRFLRAAGQYVRRFLRSPYASQFADALVGGIAAFNDKIDLAMVEETIALMDAEHQKAIYLRLARISAIDGLTELAAFASQRVAAFEANPGGGADARAMLYASLSTVTSETAAEVLAKLRSIDRSRLAARDQELLDAALSIAAGVVSVPDAVVDVSLPRRVEPLEVEEIAPAIESRPDATHVAAPGADAVHETKAAGGQAAAAADPAVAIVGETRRKLEEIDKLLMDTQ